MTDDDFGRLLARIRQFVDDRLIPSEEQVERDRKVPEPVIEEMREIGLFGLSIPTAFGGAGMSMVQEAAAIRALGRASLVFRGIVGTTVGIGSQCLVIDGTDAQRQAWLPKMAVGGTLAFAGSEADAGSDIGAVATRADLDGGRYRIRGTKISVSNAHRALLFMVLARTGPERGQRGLSAFLVPGDTPGIAIGEPYRLMGQHGLEIRTVAFDCVLPREAIVGGVPGQGFKTVMKALDRGRLHIASLACGTAERMLDEALRHAVRRHQFGQPLGAFQLVQGMLAESRADLLAAVSMVDAVARRFDAGERVTMEASCCKFFATEAAGRIADRALQIHGGAGYIADSPIERLFRDARVLRLYDGASEVQQVVIARAMLRDAGVEI